MKKLLVLLCFVLCFSSALSAKLLTYFEFESSLGDSAGDNDGSVKKWDTQTNAPKETGATYSLTGKIGKALYFNGTDHYFEFGKGDFDPRYNGRYSISMWVYSTEQASSSNNNSYIGKHTSSRDNSILFGYWGGELSFRIKSAVVHISTAGSEPLNTWVHYAISAKEQDNGTTYVVIYKDGSQIWSGTLNDVAGTFSEDDKPWVLGMDWDVVTPQTDFFKGKMDNVRIYDLNITADEVREIYLKESAKLHLNLDDTYDDSVEGESGSQFGGVYFKQGMENRSAYFDGYNDYVEFGTGTTDPRSFGTLANYYSISMWVKSDAQATSSNNNAYIAKHSDTNGDIFRFGYWSNKLILKIGSNSAEVSAVTEPVTWTHYVITGTENKLTLTTSITVYKNGSQLWTGNISTTMGSFAANFKPWVLGRKWGGSADYFKGEMDNVRFYARVLSEADVKALYRSEFSGVRYCNTDQNSAGCTVVNNTVYDLSQYSWLIASGTGFNGIPIFLPVSHTSIETIKVSDGWEVYLCTQANHQGSCYFYGDNFRTINSTLTNNVYSMTVQPSSFSAAKKFFGFRRADGSENSPAGFAYIYEQINFEPPSKTYYSSRRRLFMNSYDRDDFSGGLQNSIIRKNKVVSAELYGDVYLDIDNSNYESKYLMTSHNDFSKNMSSYSSLDMRNYYQDVRTIILGGNYDVVGSVGWFISSDFPDGNRLKTQCLKGVSKTLNYNATRIECTKYNMESLPFYIAIAQDPDEFFKRIYPAQSIQKLERYADNYSLLMLSGHGSYNPQTPDSPLNVSIRITNEDEARRIRINNIGTDSYSKNLGKQYTRWMETTACYSMGENDTNWTEVGGIYYNLLTRLNGVGAYRSKAWWGHPTENHNYDNHWHDLTYNNKTVSKAWVDSWSESFIGTGDRDARFLTLETCNCTDTNCTETYMKNDYFYNVLDGPKPQKNNLTNYNYYCFRDRESSNFSGFPKSSSTSSQKYPEEFVTYSYDSAPDWLIEQLFDIKIAGNDSSVLETNTYNYKDNYLILTRKDKNISAVMNREMISFEDEKESEDIIWNKFNEAKETAESLTSMELKFAGISRDVNEAFKVGGNGESLGKMINSIAFVFRPVINGVPIFSESIEVEYDAEGFYQLRSNVPYSVSKIRESEIKSEDQLEEEIYSVLGKEEEKIIAYVLNKDNELVLSAVAKDDANETFLTISLEANHE